MDNLHIDRNGTVPEPPGSDLTIVLVYGSPVPWAGTKSGPRRVRPDTAALQLPDLRLISRGYAEPGKPMRKLDLQRSSVAIRRLTDRLRSELKVSISPARYSAAHVTDRTEADHVIAVDCGADAPMGLLPEAITLALLLALGRQ